MSDIDPYPKLFATTQAHAYAARLSEFLELEPFDSLAAVWLCLWGHALKLSVRPVLEEMPLSGQERSLGRGVYWRSSSCGLVSR